MARRGEGLLWLKEWHRKRCVNKNWRGAVGNEISQERREPPDFLAPLRRPLNTFWEGKLYNQKGLDNKKQYEPPWKQRVKPEQWASGIGPWVKGGGENLRWDCHYKGKGINITFIYFMICLGTVLPLSTLGKTRQDNKR